MNKRFLSFEPELWHGMLRAAASQMLTYLTLPLVGRTPACFPEAAPSKTLDGMNSHEHGHHSWSGSSAFAPVTPRSPSPCHSSLLLRWPCHAKPIRHHLVTTVYGDVAWSERMNYGGRAGCREHRLPSLKEKTIQSHRRRRHPFALSLSRCHLRPAAVPFPQRGRACNQRCSFGNGGYTPLLRPPMAAANCWWWASSSVGAGNAARWPHITTVAANGFSHLTLAGTDLGALLPSDLSSFRYTGSLTTSPYTEGVVGTCCQARRRCRMNRRVPHISMNLKAIPGAAEA